MRAFVTDAQGAAWELPPAQSWEMEYGIGTPCDSFALRCPWQMGMGTKRESWSGFYAEYNGARVFTGVVDECEMVMDGRGCHLELSGRGMAALLLDNEALGQDYQLATIKDILRDHVIPYGIEVSKVPDLPRVARFRVDTGSSEWTALEEFLRECGGPTPRFDGWGRMILGDLEGSRCLKIDSAISLTRLCYRDKRYGVLSEILVRDRYSGTVQSVENQEFSVLGGRARRVLTMPGHAVRSEMIRTGKEQLKRSRAELVELEITITVPFAAMPGQLVSMERAGFDHNGRYRVAKSATGADENGYWTRLTLRPEECM